MKKFVRLLTVTFAVLSAALSSTANAAPAYTTIDLDNHVTRGITINPDTMPIGQSTGNQGTDIPFDLSASPLNASHSGIWLASDTGGVLTVDLSAYDLTGQTYFYALLNNFYGTSGVNEYNVTISTLTQSVTYQSIGNYDTRDYNSSTWTNGVLASTTTPWYDNGIGQRYDVRTFALPSSFADEAIISFSITQVNSRDSAALAGLTFYGSSVAAVPEPETYAMLLGPVWG
ncbi:MAG: hypothetical protein LBS89_05270 [Zoogloeaceae bacterium]|jgi:hypothetical protein|nr:hypothetical protein [Zoogloeaceae bacterium]